MSEAQVRIDANASVEVGAAVGAGTIVWGHAQVRAGATVGRECVVGRGAFIDAGVVVGDRCKIQNHALVYAPATLGIGVFIGPAAVLTNDLHPRAVNPDMSPKGADDWDAVGVEVGDGAAIGARAVCVAPVSIGRWAMVAAGAVVTRSVPDHALVAGVPARQVGWVGESGVRLDPHGVGGWLCSRTGATYVERDGALVRDS